MTSLQESGLSLLEQAELEQQREELKKAITACKKFMTQENLDWISRHPLTVSIVMHPISLMAFESQGRIQGYERGPLENEKQNYRPKINGKHVGVNSQLPRNQILMLDIAGNIIGSVFLALEPGKTIVTAQ